MELLPGLGLVKFERKPLRRARLALLMIVVLACALFIVFQKFSLKFFHADAPLTTDSKQTESPPISESSPGTAALPVIKLPAVWAGVLPVTQGVILLRAGESAMTTRQVIVGPFAIAETEVTNEQYREFVKETGRKAPAHWVDQQYPPGTANEPVTMVTWQQAVDYCTWLSQKIGSAVRLPTEAEWEMAARGENDLQYPWGNDWDDRAATCAESSGQVRAVRSYPAGRSPAGAYDMAGNVWEWVGDDVVDDEGKPVFKDGSTVRIAKGGAANEPRKFIGAQVRALLPPEKPRRFLGFRYVVIRKSPERPD